MIAYLSGKVLEKTENSLIVLTAGGVGYEVFVPVAVIVDAKVGANITLKTYTKVGEQVLDLYGFATEDDRAIFLTLLSVNGVGAKTGLLILSVGSNDQLRNAIAGKDIAFLTAVPGIGKRTAERIVVELKDKIGGVAISSDMSGDTATYTTIVDALQGLGYGKEEIMAAIHALEVTDLPEEKLLKKVLQQLAR